MAPSPTELASYKPQLHSQNSWLPSSESANSKPQNNVDLSWLPNYNDTNDSYHPDHQYPQTDSDDSWLPNYNDTKFNHSDDSWLPSTPIVKNKNKNHDSRVPTCKNYNSTAFLKSDNSNRSQKPETSPDRSWLPSTSIAINGDKQKEINSHHKKSTNQQTQNTTILNKKPESSISKGQASPSISECSVETDSLGGVSTLLRRWKDAETKNPNRRSKPSSCSSNNNDNHTTDESLVDSESCKPVSSVPVSCIFSLRGTNDLKAVDIGENKCFPSVIGKPRLIRGRQAFIDFLNMMEQDKRRELESLTLRNPVSKFQNRGRIQALLHVRLIRIGAENQKQTKSQKHSVSKTMKSLWDKFSTGVKQDSTASRKVSNNVEVMKKSNTGFECSVDRHPVRDESTTTTTAINSQELVLTTTSHQSSVIDEKELADCIPVQSEMKLENCHQWINECSQTQSDWGEDEEEEKYSDYNYNYNWISDITRPRSDWECMRQKRYQEMLHLHSYNQDIQQLLQRKSVSGFLSSDQRNIIDQLILSRAQGVPRTESKKEDEFIDETACSSAPTQSPALEQRSWNHHHHHHPNVIYDNHQMASSAQCPSVWPNVYLQNNTTPQSSFINHPSIEMEVIYDLRGYVQQIHQEVMELRKAVTTCVNMQLKNQHHSIQKKRSEQVSTTRNCCVCYAMQVDSFLYRCGHMCTCYDCGLELQCSSSKCPICDDTILDVVRAHAYGD